MTGPTPVGVDSKGPWILLEADSRDVTVFGMCVPAAVAIALPKEGESSCAGGRVVVEISHRAQDPTESPRAEWRVWIAWSHHARLVGLDVASVCSRCGHLILDAGVKADGTVFVGH